MSERMIYSPETIIKAYTVGIFPMAESAEADTIHFYDPKRRAVVPLDYGGGGEHTFHIPRRLLRTVRQNRFDVAIDRDFAGVIDGCAAATDKRRETWINGDIRQLYIALHKLGFAHSIEAWEGERLVGGLYGVAVRGAFFGESMFSRATDASKVALVHLVARLRAGGFTLLDAQFQTEHLTQFGIFEIDRAHFHTRLNAALAAEANLLLAEPSQGLVEAMVAGAE